jgi:hypothetical protein
VRKVRASRITTCVVEVGVAIDWAKVHQAVEGRATVRCLPAVQSCAHQEALLTGVDEQPAETNHAQPPFQPTSRCFTLATVTTRALLATSCVCRTQACEGVTVLHGGITLG